MGMLYVVNSPLLALAASATKSLVLVAPVDSFRVVAWGVSFNAASSSATVGVELYRTTTIGTPAGTAVNAAAAVDVNYSADEGNDCSVLLNLTTEPTAVEVIEAYEIQPFGGDRAWRYPLGQEPHMSGTSTQRIGVRVITPAATTPSVRATLTWEE